MSEEEKKAIELLKNKNTEYYYRFIDVRDAVSTLLNLIEKQQNKIEAKEMEHQYDQKMIDDLKGEMVHNWLHKDKIREIFQFYIERDSLFNDDAHKMAVIRLKDVSQELLEEN